MTAMLTYRTRTSYEHRFGRNLMEPSSQDSNKSTILSAAEVHRHAHNAGHRQMKDYPSSTTGASWADLQTPGQSPSISRTATPSGDPVTSVSEKSNANSTYEPPLYAAHSYLRYQADKFNERFDPNCYIALSRKMDDHDVSRGRGEYESVVRGIQQPTLVIGRVTMILQEETMVKKSSTVMVE